MCVQTVSSSIVPEHPLVKAAVVQVKKAFIVEHRKKAGGGGEA
jgi:hypothetical protein